MNTDGAPGAREHPKYSVDLYIDKLKLAKKSNITLRDYRGILGYYADFLGIPLDDLHKNLHPQDLMRWAGSLEGKAVVTRTKFLRVVARFMKLNGVMFDELDLGVITAKGDDGVKGDEPLTRQTAQRMIDVSDPQMKAAILLMTSTGCRAGETSMLKLSDIGRIQSGRFVPDIDGSVINIRNEIAKGKKGGLVFLTSEAREFLSAWLTVRDDYIRMATVKSQNLRKGSTGRTRGAKHNGEKITRPENDTRIFACSYYTLSEKFKKMYALIENGRKDKFGRGAVVPHRCRAFFRTNAAKTMGVDLAEGILRHSGYLNQSYVRMTPEEREKEFHDGEYSLYITRPDQRLQGKKISELEKEIVEMREKVALVDKFYQQQKVMADLMKQILPGYDGAKFDPLNPGPVVSFDEMRKAALAEQAKLKK